MSDQLAKTLTLGKAVGLALTIVIGSGLLVLPGLAYRQVGDAAIYAWILDGLLVVPLLFVFARLGRAIRGRAASPDSRKKRFRGGWRRARKFC